MLIFANGTLGYSSTSGSADLDANGYPVAASSFDNEVNCTISTLTENRKGNADGARYKSCQYSVSVDMSAVESDFNPKYIKLTHENKGELGVFTVQRIEYYNITGSIELWV